MPAIAAKEKKDIVRIAAIIVGVCLAFYILYQTDGCSKAYQFPRFSTGTKDKPITLPDDALAELQVNAVPYNGVVAAEVYNGSAWTVTSVDLEIFKAPAGAPRVYRRFRFTTVSSSPSDVALRPYTTGNFQAPVGDFLAEIKDKTQWGFTLPEAAGYK